MSRTHPLSLGDYQDQVEGMIKAGERFGVVEDTINTAALVDDQKAASGYSPGLLGTRRRNDGMRLLRSS